MTGGQLGLFPTSTHGPTSAGDALATKDRQGWVIHPRSGSLRVQGRTADGRWVCHRCDRFGKDQRPEVVVILLADRLPPVKP